ncbi:MAG: hypothetical protein E6G95_19085 [Alphaproteobacteria bacterium]|nr:MAG: hypothetical protein E6G95_19085 [Alphaproteobacteria bacterium]
MHIARHEAFFDFYLPRLYAMLLGQIPVMAAVTLGVTDLHLLARLLSLGLFALPTIFYTLALRRAKDDPVLLAVVIAAIAIVFMTTSFFIVGEYNTLYAVAILIAVRLGTAERLTLWNSVILLLLALLAIRIYLGPLLGGIILWKLWRAPARPVVPTLLHLASAVFMILAMMVAINSVVHPHSAEHLVETWVMAADFWQNLQFDLVFGATLLVVVWGLVKPHDLKRPLPYLVAGLFLGLLALSPLLALNDGLVRPLAKSQYVARTVSGLIIGGMIVLIVTWRSPAVEKVRALAALRLAAANGRFLTFAFVMLVAGVPADLFLTQSWVNYLDVMRSSVRGHGGVIAVEDTPIGRRPHALLIENWVLTSQSLLLRGKPGDGVLAPPRDFTEWVPFPPQEPPNLGRFYWRD